MKDAAKVIRAAYVNILSGIGINVYDEVAPIGNPDSRYILIGTQTQNGARYKDHFIPDCTVVVDIIFRRNRPTGKLEVDQVADDVLSIIIPLTGGIDLSPDFQCVRTELISSESGYALSGTDHIYRRILIIGHKVLEK